MDRCWRKKSLDSYIFVDEFYYFCFVINNVNENNEFCSFCSIKVDMID